MQGFTSEKIALNQKHTAHNHRRMEFMKPARYVSECVTYTVALVQENVTPNQDEISPYWVDFL